jgi:hypothetical protein
MRLRGVCGEASGALRRRDRRSVKAAEAIPGGGVLCLADAAAAIRVVDEARWAGEAVGGVAATAVDEARRVAAAVGGVAATAAGAAVAAADTSSRA